MAYTPTFDDFGNEVFDGGEVHREGPTGREVTTRSKEPLQAMIEGYENGNSTYIHIAKMKQYNVPSDVVSSYTGVTQVDVKKYLNRSSKIIGACLWFSGVYTPKEPRFDGELREGYYKVLLKTADFEKEEVVIDRKVYELKHHVIIQTSSKRIAELALPMIEQHGWFDWPEGVVETVVFSGDPDSGYLMRTIGDLKQFATEVGK